LASKYRLHPDVEPEYHETYRPDLGHPVVNSRSLATLSSTQLGFGASHSAATLLSAGGATLQSPAWGQRSTARGPFSSLQSSTVSLSSMQEVPWSMRSVSRSSSVPGLGTRRACLAPASLQPLPPGVSQTAPLDKTGRALSRSNSAANLLHKTHAETVVPSDDPKAVEKERQAEVASRRLWVAAEGNKYFLATELAHMREDPALGNKDFVSSLGKSQTCVQMSKARKEGAKIDWRSPDWDGATLLIKAIRTGSPALAMHLIGAGVDTSLPDYSGRGILHWVAIEGNAEIAEVIFDVVAELELDKEDEGGDTPLHLAAFHGHLEVARLLVANGADVSKPNALGYSASELAQAARAWHVATYLTDTRLQQEDVAAKGAGTAKLQNLVRPCDHSRAIEVRRIDAADAPKPK